MGSVMPPDQLTEPDSPRPTTVARRAPLLWVGVVLLAGYILAAWWPEVPPKALASVACFFATIALAVALRAPLLGFRQKKIAIVWGGAFFIAGTLLAWAWHEVRAPAPPAAWAALPPREATLTIRIARSFSRKSDTEYVGGFAEILNAPPILADLTGRSLLYRVRARTGEYTPERGATLEVSGLVSYLPELIPDLTHASSTEEKLAADNAAQFRAYVHSQGAWFELARGRLEHVVSPPSAWQNWLAAQHEKIKKLLQVGPQGLEKNYGNIYAALLLGEPTLLQSDQRDAFTASGEIYLFAVSGLHIAILAAVLWWALRRIPGLPHWAGETLTLTTTWLYVAITGNTPSGQRAALMLTFYLLARWLSRARSPLAAWVAAGTLTLIWDPTALDNAGFELSFGVVLGLILYAAPLCAALETRWRPWRDIPPASHAPWQKCVGWAWRRFIDAWATSWTAVLCSVALMAEFFGTFSLHVLWLNIIFLPLTCLTLSAGTLAVAGGLAGLPPFSWIAWLANAVGLLAVAMMDALAQSAPHISVLTPNLHVVPTHAGSLATLAVLAVMLCFQPKSGMPRRWYFALPVVVLTVFAVFCVRVV